MHLWETQPTLLGFTYKHLFVREYQPLKCNCFYKSMSAVRCSVEWIFGDIINYFKFLDFKKNLKIGLSQVGKMYIVCAILRNALTCMYQNSTAQFF